MKKLMIAAAIVCAAAYAQAASFGWAASADAFAWSGSSEYTEFEGYKIYAFDASTYSAAQFAEDAANTTVGGLAAFDNALSLNDGEVNSVANAAFAFAGTGLTDGADTGTINAYLVALSSVQADGKQYYYLMNVDPITVNPVVTESGASLSVGEVWIDSLPGAGSADWTAVAAVPEPTSGLLLLIGVAGLALRRRRA